MSRVLVTGASGFVGRAALRPLVERGFEVHAVSSRAAPPEGTDHVVWQRANLLAPAEAERLVRAVAPTHLLHLAWYAEPGRFWSAPENVAWVEASLRLLRAFAAAGGRRAVVAGSCAEYDWAERPPYSERTTPLRPRTLYGACKASLHTIAAAYAEQQDDLACAWGRIFFLYGPGEQPGRLVSSVVEALVAGREAETTEGSQLRDFLFVEDAGAAFAALVASDVTGAVNVASGEGVPVGDVVAAAAATAGRPELVRRGALASRPDEPAAIVADVGRLREEVGFSPRFGLDEGMRRTLDWWRQR